jgi:hypothetical protein
MKTKAHPSSSNWQISLAKQLTLVIHLKLLQGHI